MVLGSVVIIRHELFHTYAFDLGVFVQALYTTWSNRRLLFETPDTIISESYLGVHFSPILFLLVPLAGLLPLAETLLLLQTVVLALPTYFLYRDMYIKTGSGRLACLISIWYLSSPALHGVNLYDFHTQSMMVLPSLLLMKALKNYEVKKSTLLLVLLFTMNEQALFIGLGCIVYLLMESRRRFAFKLNLKLRSLIIRYDRDWMRELLAVISTTAIMTVIAFTTISMIGKPPIHPEKTTLFFPQLGATWAEVVSSLFSWRIINAVMHDIILKASYWLILLFPLYFYGWRAIAREAIPALLPWIVFTFITGYKPFYTIGWHFNGLILGIIASAALEAIRQLQKGIKLFIIITLTLTALLSPVSIAPYFLAKNMNTPLWRGAAYDFNPFFTDIANELEVASTIRAALSSIPSNASILCTTNIFPHVATRMNAYVGNVQDVEYILLDYRYIGFGYFGRRLLSLVSTLNESYRYGVVMYADGILLLRRNYTSAPQLIKPYEVHIDPRTLSWVEGVNVSFNDAGHAELKLKAEEEKLIWFGPYLMLPPGLYEVRINALRGTEGKLTVKIVNYISGETLATSSNDILQFRCPIDNAIEVKGYFIGGGELTLCSIEIKLIHLQER
jgi:uncharacterized membrane protein